MLLGVILRSECLTKSEIRIMQVALEYIKIMQIDGIIVQKIDPVPLVKVSGVSGCTLITGLLRDSSLRDSRRKVAASSSLAYSGTDDTGW